METPPSVLITPALVAAEEHDHPLMGRPRPSQSGNRSQTSPFTITQVNKDHLVMQLRVEGKSFQDIADAVGYQDRNSARDAVTRALRRWNRENVEEGRTIELERLDLLTNRLIEEVVSGPPDRAIRAADSFIRVSDRRARLMGLDAPMEIATKVEATVDHTIRVAVVADVNEYLDLIGQVVTEEVEAREPMALEVGSREVEAELA